MIKFYLTFGAILTAALLTTTGCQKATPLPVIAQLPTFTPTPAKFAPENSGTEVPLGVSFVTLAPPTAVVIQTTPSPLPPPTETATPTPIIYTIVEGDTILGIAIDYFTTTDEILTRNPQVQPNLLSIGQEIILPPPATAVFSGEPATPIPLNILISSVQSYPTQLGSSWILGEVHNNSPFFVEDLQLELSFIGQDGVALGKANGWTAFSLLAPEERAPFALLITDPPGTIEQTQVAIINGRAFPNLDPATDNRMLNLTVRNDSFQVIDNSVTVKGEIVNEGGETAVQTQLTVTLYDQQNNVSGYGQLTLDRPLLPQESAPFDLALAPPGATTAQVRFHTQSLREGSPDTTPSP